MFKENFLKEKFAVGDRKVTKVTDICAYSLDDTFLRGSAFDTSFFKNAAEPSSGIRILKQDPWEAICSFIISQNNNIPRIRKIIRELSSAYGVNLALQNGLKSVQ